MAKGEGKDVSFQKDICSPYYNVSLAANGTSPSSAAISVLCWSLPFDARVGLMCLYALIFLFGVIGNFLVCYVLGVKRKKTLTRNFYIIALAVTDLLASITNPLQNISTLFTKDGIWYLGAAMCKLNASFSKVTLIVSTWTLVLIAGVRYRGIVHPMKPRISVKKKCIGLVIVWLFAFGNAMPYMLSVGIEDGKYCRVMSGKLMTKKEVTTYNWVWMAGNWIVPMGILCVLYSQCMKKLRENKLKYCRNNSMKIRAAENKRVVKMLSIVVCVHFTLTMPYTLFYIWMSYMVAYNPQDMDLILILTLNYALLVPTNINSCVNPFIYARTHREINAAFIKKLPCCRSASDGKKWNKSYKPSVTGKAFSREQSEQFTCGSGQVTYEKEESSKADLVSKRENVIFNKKAFNAQESQITAESIQDTVKPILEATESIEVESISKRESATSNENAEESQNTAESAQDTLNSVEKADENIEDELTARREKTVSIDEASGVEEAQNTVESPHETVNQVERAEENIEVESTSKQGNTSSIEKTSCVKEPQNTVERTQETVNQVEGAEENFKVESTSKQRNTSSIEKTSSVEDPQNAVDSTQGTINPADGAEDNINVQSTAKRRNATSIDEASCVEESGNTAAEGTQDTVNQVEMVGKNIEGESVADE